MTEQQQTRIPRLGYWGQGLVLIWAGIIEVVLASMELFGVSVLPHWALGSALVVTIGLTILWGTGGGLSR